jgi:hypothetical protein
MGHVHLSQKFLDLLNGDLSGIQQDRRDRVSQQMRRDTCVDAGGASAVGDDRLHRTDRIARVPIALEEIAVLSLPQMCAKFLSQRWQNRDVAVRLSFGVGDVDLWRVAIQAQVLDAKVNQLSHPRARLEQHLDHQAVRAVMLVGGLHEAFNFASIQPVDRSVPRARRLERQPATNPLHDVCGLIVSQMMLAPEPECLVDDFSQALRGLRLCSLTTRLGTLCPLLNRHEGLPKAEFCAVSTIDAVGIVPGSSMGGRPNLHAPHQQGDASPGVTSLTEAFGGMWIIRAQSLAYLSGRPGTFPATM